MCFGLVLFCLAALFLRLAIQYQQRFHMAPASFAGVYACFVCLAALVLAPAFLALRRALRKLPFRILPAMWCAPYVLYVCGTGDMRIAAACKVAAVAVLPVVYVIWPVRRLRTWHWQDAVFGACLVVFVLSRAGHDIWNVPVHLDFMERFYLIAVAAGTWTAVRPVRRLGYWLHVDIRSLREALWNFALFACCALPVGFGLGFNAWHPRWRGAGDLALSFIEIFLFVALLEETFFRGFLQSLLTESWQSWWKAQLFVACLFGLFHILHAPFPNWRYVILASLAGWFYGSAYRQGKGLLASTLMHALVDTVWRTWFTAP